MPFASKKQWKMCRVKGDPGWDCSEWAHETPSYAKLPVRKRKKKKSGADSLDAAKKAFAATMRKFS